MATILTVFKSKESWSLSNFKLNLYCPETPFKLFRVFVCDGFRVCLQPPVDHASDAISEVTRPKMIGKQTTRPFTMFRRAVSVFQVILWMFFDYGKTFLSPLGTFHHTLGPSSLHTVLNTKVQKTNLGCDVSRMWCFNVFELQTDFKKVPSGCEWRNAASSKVHHLSTVLMEEIRLTTWDVRINPCK